MPVAEEKTKEFYAHNIEGKPVQEWQLFEYHLNRTANI